MIDEVRGPGIEGSRGAGPTPRRNRPETPADPAIPERPMVELRNRLSAVAGDLERLLERLASLQEQAASGSEILDRLKTARHDPGVVLEIGRLARRGAFDLPSLSGEPAALEAVGVSVREHLDRSARQREGIERSISQSQVALQNIIAADTAEPSLPPGAPPFEGLRLDPRNILQLLGPA